MYTLNYKIMTMISPLDDMLIYFRRMYIRYDGVFTLIWILCLSSPSNISYRCPARETKESTDLERKVK